MAIPLSPYADAQTAKVAMQTELNRMPWDGSGYIDPLDKTVDYFIKSYGVGTGLSAEEIRATVANAYYYNGIPEGGYAPTSLSEGDGGYSGGTGGTVTGPTQAEKDAALQAHLANLDSYNRQRTKAESDAGMSLQGLQQNEQDLMTQRGKGYEQNQAYFSNVSPDAFQSQIMNYNTKVLDAYNQGMNTVANNRENIQRAKQNTLNDIDAAIRAENAYNYDTASYDNPNYRYQSYDYVAPQLQTVTQSPYAQAAMLPGQNAQWSPNIVGTQEDPYKFLK